MRNLFLLALFLATAVQGKPFGPGQGNGNKIFGPGSSGGGGGGGGISSLNSQSDSVQSFATGTSGTDFDIVSGSGTHTFNLPNASASARGLVSTGTQSFEGVKTFNAAPVFDSLTAARACYIDADKKIASSAVTATELGYLSGVSSAVQTQLNSKAPIASPTFTGTITTPVTASRAVVTDGSSALSASATTSTELGYVSGVTSAIQTQLNAKAPLASPTFTGTVTTPVTASRALVTGSSSELSASSVTATELGYLSGVTSAVQTQLSARLLDSGDTMTGNLLMDNQTSVRLLEQTGGGTDYVGLQGPDSISSSYTIKFPNAAPSSNTYLKYNGSSYVWDTAGGGSFTGPGSSTDNAIVRFDGTGGATVQDSAVTVADTTGVMTFPNNSSTAINFTDGVGNIGVGTSDAVGTNRALGIGAKRIFRLGASAYWLDTGTGHSTLNLGSSALNFSTDSSNFYLNDSSTARWQVLKSDGSILITTTGGQYRGAYGTTSKVLFSSNGDIDTGFNISAADTAAIVTAGANRVAADSAGNVTVGVGSLSTSATDGFPYIPAMAGTPTGVPTTKSGFVPPVYDTSNNKLCVYNSGWKCSAAFTTP